MARPNDRPDDRSTDWPLVGAERMRALDTHTIDVLGVPGELLMESAGRAVVEAVLAERTRAEDEVLVFCGAGNNGGDGFVVARHLALLGVPVRLVGLRGPDDLAGDAAANARRCRALGLAITSVEEAASARTPAAVVVDALLGTGLTREVAPDSAAGRAIDAVELRREQGARVVAVDVPSGLDADTGQALGRCVRADVTVTIGLPKSGLVLEPGASLAGRVRIARIGIADEIPGVRHDCHRFGRASARAALPERPRAGHKGRFGHVLVVAGSQGKTGAAALSARAAARVGAGLVTLACPAGLNDVLETLCTEAMTVPVADTPARALAATAEETLLALAAERDVVALGPGLGREPETEALVRAFVKRCDRPLVLDADGLNALGHDGGLLRGRTAATVLTPHPGEAARLLATTPAAVNADRLGAARELATCCDAFVLLKGAPTVTASPDGATWVNASGGPALGSGGTGDVLTGTVAGLLAQGVAAGEAAALAAWVHGAAGDRWAATHGDAGLLASDLADGLPAVLRDLRDPAADGAGIERRGGLLLDLADS